MKKLLLLALCLSLLSLPLIAAANEAEPPEAQNGYDYEYAEYTYNEEEYTTPDPEPDYIEPEPEDTNFDHSIMATMEELYAFTNGMQEYEPYAEELYSFDPPQPPPVIPPPRYTSAAVVVMDAETGLVLYGSEHNTQFYPASITKIMTALLVLEHVTDLTERIEFSHNAVFSIPRDSSHIAMDVGETLTVYQALYGLMLSSANEVSIALAEHVAGSVDEFSDLMNRRAASLGANNTHFVNPSGLPGTGHVTTAYDMALIMREAVKHPVFVDIIGTRRFDIPPTERQPRVRELLNTNRLIHPGSYFNEWVVGSKTGWTHAAQHTLVTYAERDGRRLIISALRGESGGPFRDTLALMSFGFSMPFEERLVFESAAYSRTVPVYQDINGTPLNIGYVTVRADDDLHFMVPVDFDGRELRYNLSIPERVAPPILAGDVLGQVTVYIQNVRAGNVDLIAQNLVLALPAAPGEEPGAGGSESTDIGLTYYAPPTGGNYPYLSAYPTTIWDNEYLLTIALPVAVAGLTILISLIVIVSSRRRRMRKILRSNKGMRYYRSYRYR